MNAASIINIILLQNQSLLLLGKSLLFFYKTVSFNMKMILQYIV